MEPGDDPARCAGEVFSVLKRIMGPDTLGARMLPVLPATFSGVGVSPYSS